MRLGRADGAVPPLRRRRGERARPQHHQHGDGWCLRWGMPSSLVKKAPPRYSRGNIRAASGGRRAAAIPDAMRDAPLRLRGSTFLTTRKMAYPPKAPTIAMLMMLRPSACDPSVGEEEALHRQHDRDAQRSDPRADEHRREDTAEQVAARAARDREIQHLHREHERRGQAREEGSAGPPSSGRLSSGTPRGRRPPPHHPPPTSVRR